MPDAAVVPDQTVVLSEEDAKVEAGALNEAYADDTFSQPTTPPAQVKVSAPAQVEATEPVKTEPVSKPDQPKQEAQKEPAEPVTITKDQLDKLMATASEVDGLKAAMKQRNDEFFGRLGSLQDTVKKVQAETPSGQAVTLTRDDFPTLVKDFGPELADSLLEGLNKRLGQAKVDGTAAAPAPKPAESPEPPKPASGRPEAADEMTALREDWGQIIGLSGPNGEPPPNTPFRQWLATQPDEYRQKIEATESPLILNAAITKFEKATVIPPEVKPDKPEPDRRARKEAAVQPKGAGGGMPASPTEHDGFKEGYGTA
jgi:chemotaxis protein histidine kinase CheA